MATRRQCRSGASVNPGRGSPPKRRGQGLAHYKKWTGTELVKCQQTESWPSTARARAGANRTTSVWHCWTGRTPWAAPLTRGQRRRQRPARSGRAVQPYVCLSVCVRLHVLCIHACMYTCMHACMHACIYACMFVCMHVCMMFICLWFGTQRSTPPVLCERGAARL